LLAVQISSWWYPTPDACGYVSIARSLAQGGPATNLGSAQLWYSPGYPLLLAPLFWLSERPFLLISILHWLLATGFLLGCYRWVRQVTPEAAVVVSGLAVVNLGVWVHFRRPLSEIAFMCVAIWGATWLSTLRQQTLAGQPRMRTALAAGLLIAAACLIRHAGFALACGFGLAALCDLLQRRVPWVRTGWTLAVITLPAVVALASVMHYEAQTAARLQAGTYLSRVDDPGLSFGDQLLEGIRLRISDTGQVLLPFMFKSYADDFEWLDINIVIYVLFAALLAWGWWRVVRRTRDILALAFPFYMALYVTWAMQAGGRFLVPLIGLLMVCLWEALGRFAPQRATIFAGLLVAHTIAAVGYWVGVELPRGRDVARTWPAAERLALKVRDRADRGVILACPESTQYLLEFLLDRRVPIARPTADVDPAADPNKASRPLTEAEWVVAPTKLQVPAGFEVAATTDGYALWTRTGSGSSPAEVIGARSAVPDSDAPGPR
ncbi:MAG: hypothetical protein JNG90_03595, partial [Planctomycetaceae bacterium]|nr:hypothetical protein [Planctomycetaceae bacterium]